MWDVLVTRNQFSLIWIWWKNLQWIQWIQQWNWSVELAFISYRDTANATNCFECGSAASFDSRIWELCIFKRIFQKSMSSQNNDSNWLFIKFYFLSRCRTWIDIIVALIKLILCLFFQVINSAFSYFMMLRQLGIWNCWLWNRMRFFSLGIIFHRNHEENVFRFLGIGNFQLCVHVH